MYIALMNTLLNIFILWTALAMICFAINKTFDVERQIQNLKDQGF